MYGPLPSECASKYDCAVSAVAASSASVAPFSFATTLLTMHADRYARRYGTAGFGCFVTIRTVRAFTAVTLANVFVMNPGADFTFPIRLRLKTTSAARRGFPSLNRAPLRSTNVQTLPALFDFQD